LVQALWDRPAQTIASNNSVKILRDLIAALGGRDGRINLMPAGLAQEAEEL